MDPSGLRDTAAESITFAFFVKFYLSSFFLLDELGIDELEENLSNNVKLIITI